MEELKIALVGCRNFPAKHGGLEVVVESIANHIAERDLSVHVFVGETEGEADKTVETPGLATFYVHATKAIKGKYWHTASQVLTGISGVRRLGPDIVNIHGVGPAFPLAFSKKAFGDAPTLVTAHGLDWERAKWPPIARWIFKKVALRALKNATSVSCVSTSVGSDLAALLGVEVVITPNGFDPVEVQGDAPIDLPPRYSVVMSRLTPEKNIEEVLNAYDSEISSLLGPLVVLGGGGTSYTESYELKLREMAAERDVLFLGELDREKALSVLNGASLFISMSKLEALPMAVIEAMSMGVPLLLSDIPPHRELCADASRYASLDSPEDLRELLLTHEPEYEIRRRVRAALDRVELLTWERSTDAYVAWYASWAEGANR